jgi:hypothetical protein
MDTISGLYSLYINSTVHYYKVWYKKAHPISKNIETRIKANDINASILCLSF